MGPIFRITFRMVGTLYINCVLFFPHQQVNMAENQGLGKLSLKNTSDITLSFSFFFFFFNMSHCDLRETLLLLTFELLLIARRKLILSLSRLLKEKNSETFSVDMAITNLELMSYLFLKIFSTFPHFLHTFF